MKTSLFVLAAAFALPLTAPASAQAPAQVDIESVSPLSGSWSYRSVQGGSFATFVDSSATQRFIVRCNRAARTVSLVRTAVPAAAPTLSIWTTSTARSVPARYDTSRTLTADVAATDPILDAMVFSRGRFANAAAGAPMIALPTHPEPARVVEDCRS